MLARLLGHQSTTVATLEQALLAYEHVRLPLANHVLRGSYQSGAMYEFNGALGNDLPSLGPAIEQQWGWLTRSDVIREAERAIDWPSVWPKSRM